MQLNDLRPQWVRATIVSVAAAILQAMVLCRSWYEWSGLSRPGGGKGAGFEGGQQPLAMRLPKLPGFASTTTVSSTPS